VEPIVKIVVGSGRASVDPGDDRGPITRNHIDRSRPGSVDGAIVKVNVVLLRGRVREERSREGRERGRGWWVDAQTACIGCQEIPNTIASSRSSADTVVPRIGEDRSPLGNAAVVQLQTGGLRGSGAPGLTGVERSSNHTTNEGSERESDVELHSSINKRE
jgi:hypothetical protein